jgi:hypothetical protein
VRPRKLETSKTDHSQLGKVYVNDVASGSIADQEKVYREDSILVREKSSKSAGSPPELLAIMIKREKGFNPDGGDWQFLLTDGARTKVKRNQKKGECLDCHRSQKDTDFVYSLASVQKPN